MSAGGITLLPVLVVNVFDRFRSAVEGGQLAVTEKSHVHCLHECRSSTVAGDHIESVGDGKQ